MSLAEQQKLESQYVMHTFGRKPVELVSGKGMVVEDADGNSYLDFIAGIGVCCLGHCHPAIVDALQKQTERLMHVSNYYYIKGRGQLARQLSALLNGGDADAPEPWQTFFANSGAEANECAIKLARLYARKSAEEKAREAGASDEQAKQAFEAAPRTIVVLDRSFHGRTLATLAATAQPAKQEAFQPLPGGFVSTPINDVDALKALFEQQGAGICAVMLECIQGESGVHPCTQEFLQAVRDLTNQYGAPMGACAAPRHIAEAFQPGDHGTTFGGSCLAIAAAQATLNTLADGFTQHINEVGAYMREKLATVPHVKEVRGVGFMNAVDLDESVDAPSLVTAALKEGLLLNATGAHTLRFLPPLVCEKSDIDTMVQRLSAML